MIQLLGLNEVSDFIMGQAPHSSTYNTNGVGDLLIKAGDFGELYPTPETFTTSPIAFSKKGDVVICVVGATSGKVNLGIDASITRSVAALRPRESTDMKYLYYLLKGSYNKLNKAATGSAQGILNKTTLSNFKIPLPPLATQKKITAILDAADSYRQKTKTLIDKYDVLTQSLFLDMFGDPVINPKGWEKLRLTEITTKIGSGATPKGGKEAYKSEGISLVRSLNIHDNEFKYKDLALIDEKQAAKLNNVILELDDVLFNITGASVCRCCILPSNILPARVNQHVSIVRPKKSIINSYFLMFCLISKNVKTTLLGIGGKGGATREAITKTDLENFELIIPSIELQNQFAARVQAIETQKAMAQQALQQADNLFNSLLQMAFKGELVT